MNFFAKNILFLRKHKGWTQAEIPANIDISRATWSNYENNSTQPDLEKLIRIARCFSVQVDDLLTVDLSKNPGLVNNAEDIPGQEKSIAGTDIKRILYFSDEESTEAKENQETAIWYLLREVKAIRKDIDELKAKSAKGNK